MQKLQKNYDALLQMYGEKAEEAEELKLDPLDVKAMYRSQVMYYCTNSVCGISWEIIGIKATQSFWQLKYLIECTVASIQ